MIYPNLQAIVASQLDGLIGDSDKIPWHHSGDLKHFKEVTMGSALIMGLKTVKGIAKNYFQGRELLPGRRIYVALEHLSQLSVAPQEICENILNETGAIINWKNVFTISTQPGSAQLELNRVMDREGRSSKIFIAGGAKTYDRYINFASDIYLTVIRQEDKPSYKEPVYLSSSLQQTLFNNSYGYGMAVIKDSQTIHKTTAEFIKISKLRD